MTLCRVRDVPVPSLLKYNDCGEPVECTPTVYMCLCMCPCVCVYLGTSDCVCSNMFKW